MLLNFDYSIKSQSSVSSPDHKSSQSYTCMNILTQNLEIDFFMDAAANKSGSYLCFKGN